MEDRVSASGAAESVGRINQSVSGVSRMKLLPGGEPQTHKRIEQRKSQTIGLALKQLLALSELAKAGESKGEQRI